jgi:molybdopterin-containing oxidoreductase family iron-sulfur binding subunit
MAKQLRLTNSGAGLHILMPPTTSPAMVGMIAKTKDAFPQARFYAWDPLHGDQAVAGAVQAFGKPVETHVDYQRAEVVVSFDCDFLAIDGNSLRSARQWGNGRREPKPDGKLSRLYVFESCYSTTGTVANHRSACVPGRS